MAYFDFQFFAASLALGWGLSLTSYRLFARRCGWPMGAVHVSNPMVPVGLGLVAVATALVFAVARGGAFGGWWIVLAGCAWAVFWTGFLRVAAQAALLLAPAATLALCAAWISARPTPGFTQRSDVYGRAAVALWSVGGRRSGGNWSNRLASGRQQP